MAGFGQQTSPSAKAPAESPTQSPQTKEVKVEEKKENAAQLPNEAAAREDSQRENKPTSSASSSTPSNPIRYENYHTDATPPGHGLGQTLTSHIVYSNKTKTTPATQKIEGVARVGISTDPRSREFQAGVAFTRYKSGLFAGRVTITGGASIEKGDDIAQGTYANNIDNDPRLKIAAHGSIQVSTPSLKKEFTIPKIGLPISVGLTNTKVTGSMGISSSGPTHYFNFNATIIEIGNFQFGVGVQNHSNPAGEGSRTSTRAQVTFDPKDIPGAGLVGRIVGKK